MKTRFWMIIMLLFFGAAWNTLAGPLKTKPIKATTATRPMAPSGPFRDVPPHHWAAQAVETLRQKGIVRGYLYSSKVKVR